MTAGAGAEKIAAKPRHDRLQAAAPLSCGYYSIFASRSYRTIFFHVWKSDKRNLAKM